MKTTIKEDFILTIIPAVEKMIEKEQNHINSMMNRKLKYTKWYYLKAFFNNVFNEIDKCIERSKKNINHYETRINEYKEYVKNLN